jgi:hypothetical protein
MQALMQIAPNKLASLHFWRWELWYDKKLRRYVIFSLVANVIGYSLVYILTAQGGMGKWWANESVSKGMAPMGLALNTLALTGKIRPTFGQATKWTAYWIPSALVGAICMGFVIAKFGLGSLESRAVAGMMMFPFDYTVKRFIVFAKHARLAAFFFKQRFSLVFAGVVLWKKLASSA